MMAGKERERTGWLMPPGGDRHGAYITPVAGDPGFKLSED